MVLVGLVPSWVIAAAAPEARPLAAQTQSYPLDIERSPLRAALGKLSIQTGLQLGLLTDMVPATVLVGPLQGLYTREQALNVLLRGTGLKYRFVNERTVAITTGESPASDKPPPERALPQELPSTPRANADTTENETSTDRKMPEHKSLLARIISSIAACGVFAAGPACAQNANGDTAAAAQPDELTEIIVTARRHEERLQDVPISITVFNQQQLADHNVTNITDLATFTPSLSSNSRFGGDNGAIAIRGFIQDQNTSPSVGLYFADVVAPRANGGTTAGNGAGPGSFFDLQNVQVLKGPQGTLFGRNTTGGAVLLVPQKPTSDLGGYVEASAGNYGMNRIQAVGNVPIGDNLRVRLGADHQQRDGYLNNISYVPGAPLVGPRHFADVDYTAVRLSVVADLLPNLENYTIASYSNSNTNGFVPKMYKVSNPPAGYRAANYAAEVAALGAGDYYNVSNGNPNPFDIIRQWQVINTTTWKTTDTLTVKNIASYAQFRELQAESIYGDNGITLGNPVHYNITADINPAPGKYNASQSTLTEELQVQGNPNDRLNYQAGAYLELSAPLDGLQTSYSGAFIDCVNLLSLQCTDSFGKAIHAEGHAGSVSISKSQYHFRDRGFYGQATYKLFDKLSLTGGFRYTTDDVSGLGEPIKVAFPAANTPSFGCSNPAGVVQGGTSAQVLADPTICDIRRNVSSSKPTWLIDLDYKPIDDVLLYAKYARGYRQGSVNVANYGLDHWGPEQVDTYEVGSKTSFQSFVRGSFNFAAFYNKFTDQQLLLGEVACAGISQPQCPFIPASAAGIVNAGKSMIKGFEAETNLNLLRGLNADVSYTYLFTRIQSLTLPPLPLGFASFAASNIGGRIPLTPEHKYSATLSYTLPLTDRIGTVTFAATGTYQSHMYGSTSSIGSGLFDLPTEELLNLNMDWHSVGGLPLDLNLFGTNVTQKRFYTFTTGRSFGFDSIILNEPAMYGVRLRYRFGKT
jgi:iron complex outermembrane receptor protein